VEREKRDKSSGVRRIGKADLLRLARTTAATAGPPAAAAAAASGALAAAGEALAGPPGAAAGAAAGAVTGGAFKALVTSEAWDFITGAAKKSERQEREQAEKEAKHLFDQLFGPLQPSGTGTADTPTRVRAGTHPDNRAAEGALLELLGITNDTVFEEADELEIAGDGGLVLFGGPNSTPYTSVAWEFDGPNYRQLRRSENPILPIRFYGLSDVTDPTLVRDVRIGWDLEGVGEVSTVNWPYIDTYRSGKTYRPEPDRRQNKRLTVKGESVFLPYDNYLLVTRLPNFMLRDLSTLDGVHPSVWPHLLVIEGNHGLGTRAVELLLQKQGLQALSDASSALRGSHAFQVLFRVEHLELTGTTSADGTPLAYHRFRTINLEEPQDLDHIGTDTYKRAHDRAWKKLDSR
jgi:hypothetical protein